jgi:hypothetical protein
MMTSEDKRAAKLLAQYDKARAEYRRLEAEVEQAAIAFGHRRGHIGFTRVETMRLMLEHMGVAA